MSLCFAFLASLREVISVAANGRFRETPMQSGEVEISRAIIRAYHKKILDCLENDVLIAGAGPAGLTAARCLAERGLCVTIVEKRLSPGGGIWGGGMTMNELVVQEAAEEVLAGLDLATARKEDGLILIDAMELASALCVKAIRAGAKVMNMLVAEDLCVSGGRVTGLVVNRTTVAETLPVDPLVFKARAVIDATGHDAAIVRSLAGRGNAAVTRALRAHGLEFAPGAQGPVGEGPMDAPAGEAFVVDRAGEVFPGLYVAGMSVCTVFGGPRMGPIFGGMLLSGKRVADLVAEALAK